MDPVLPTEAVGGEPPDSAPSGDERENDARVLLRNADGTVRMEGDVVLVAECDGLHLEHIVSRVTTFALVVAGFVGTLAASRVAPWPVGIFALSWLLAAVVARVWVAARRAEHGRFTLDFADDVVRAVTRAGTVEWTLDGAVVAELSDLDDVSDHPRWLMLRRGAARLRLAHAPPADLRPILYVLRRQGVPAPRV